MKYLSKFMWSVELMSIAALALSLTWSGGDESYMYSMLFIFSVIRIFIAIEYTVAADAIETFSYKELCTASRLVDMSYYSICFVSLVSMVSASLLAFDDSPVTAFVYIIAMFAYVVARINLSSEVSGQMYVIECKQASEEF